LWQFGHIESAGALSRSVPCCLQAHGPDHAFGKGRCAEERLKDFNSVLQEMKKVGSCTQIVDRSLAAYK
jgi:hypothetical protein